jgi:hypothetical protein
VITSDFVPIKPIVSNWVLLSPGQRYDVIFTANQTTGNYWFRALVAGPCFVANRNGQAFAIFRYADAPEEDPETTQFDPPQTCDGNGPLVPWVKNEVNSTAFLEQVGLLEVDIAFPQITTNEQNIVVWSVNLSDINIAWTKPTLQYIAENNTDYPRSYNLIELLGHGVSYPILTFCKEK